MPAPRAGHATGVNSSETKLIQYLQDAVVLEGTLRRTLIAHIAISPRDRHRELLQEHLAVTVKQERRLIERVSTLQGPPNVVQAAIGVAKASAALGFTLAKGPLDALRGTSGDDIALRNVQDESASEALEIAVYDTLEALATELGDEETADLARAHRAQEQAFLEQLRETVPELARNVIETKQGTRSFPLSTLGVLDAGRVLVAGVQTALRRVADDAQDAAPAPAAQETAAPVAPATPATPKPAAKPTAAPTAGDVKSKATKAAASTDAKDRPDQPIAEYDDMTPVEIAALLDHLPADRLDAVEEYERAHERREHVLDAITEQRELESGARN